MNVKFYFQNKKRVNFAKLLQTNKKNEPWLNKYLLKEIKKKNKMWKKYLASGKNPVVHNEYKILKKSVSKKMREGVKEFEESIAVKSKNCPRIFYSYVNRLFKPREPIKILRKPDSSIIIDPVEICEELNSQFQSVFLTESDNKGYNLDFRTHKEIEVNQLDIFSYENVLKRVESLDPHKAMGNDQISPMVLKMSSKGFSKPLSIIFKKSFLSGELPKQWLEANVTPLHKSGSKLEPSNYRPVSLTSIVCKIMESLIKEVILEHLMQNKLLNECQHGFVPKRSCVTNLLETFDFVSYNLFLKKPVDIVYMDFAKAFDKVPHKRLVYKLKRYGIDDETLKWIEGFLNNRKQRVVLGSAMSSWSNVTSGVPQGSVLGPLLFVIYINDMPDKLKHICKLFADDTKIAAVIEDDGRQILQEDIDNLCTWSEEWLMEFNEKKCKVIHYGPNNPEYEFHLNTNKGEFILEDSGCERDLGVYFTNDLKSREHVARAIKKANTTLGLIKKTFRYRDTLVIKKLYTSLVRPHLEYAVQVWNPYFKKDIASIESVQRRTTKLIKEFKNYEYSNRLEMLKLSTLEERRIRGDLIQQFKIAKGHEMVNWHYPLHQTNDQYNKRSHDFTIHRELIRNCSVRENFFTNRIATLWNRLPSELVNQSTVNNFKKDIDIHLKKLKKQGYDSIINPYAP